MAKPGPAPLPVDVKRNRGTLKASRERSRRSQPAGIDRTLRPELNAAVSVSAVHDYVAIATKYVSDILAGRIPSCVWLRKAAQRFERMRERAAEPTSAFVFSHAEADAVCAFVSACPHTEGTWKTPTIELQPWQAFLLVSIYGFRRRLDGGRLVSTVFFQVARKSAKSTLVAAMGLYHLACEKEVGGQVICGASTGQQARIVFSIMQRMIRRSSWLREQGFQVFANAVTHEASGGSARPVNSKSSTLDGLNPSFISLDESHAQDFTLHDVLKSAQGARTNPLMVAPTTAGYSLTSVGYALRNTAMQILDGVIESDHTFVVLYELDESDDWQDEAVWQKAAPMLGITPTLDYVRKYRDDAIATPGMAGEFQVKLCNRWLHSAATWLSIQAWDQCADTSLRLEDFRRERAFLGVDLAERDDIAAIALLFQRGDVLYAFVRGYLPSLVVSERSRAVPAYHEWLKSGELVTTDGNMTDYGVIEADIKAFCEQFDVQDIAIERYGALNLASNLLTAGLPARIESKNAKVFTPPAKELEARIKAGMLRHAGSSFLKWQISNVRVERRRDGSLLPTKESAESPNKIDAVDAMLLALGGLLQTPTPTVSIYDREDFNVSMVLM